MNESRWWHVRNESLHPGDTLVLMVLCWWQNEQQQKPHSHSSASMFRLILCSRTCTAQMMNSEAASTPTLWPPRIHIKTKKAFRNRLTSVLTIRWVKFNTCQWVFYFVGLILICRSNSSENHIFVALTKHQSYLYTRSVQDLEALLLVWALSDLHIVHCEYFFYWDFDMFCMFSLLLSGPLSL